MTHIEVITDLQPEQLNPITSMDMQEFMAGMDIFNSVNYENTSYAFQRQPVKSLNLKQVTLIQEIVYPRIDDALAPEMYFQPTYIYCQNYAEVKI